MSWQFSQIILSAEIFRDQKLFATRQKYVIECHLSNGLNISAANDVPAIDEVGTHTNCIENSQLKGGTTLENSSTGRNTCPYHRTGQDSPITGAHKELNSSPVWYSPLPPFSSLSTLPHPVDSAKLLNPPQRRPTPLLNVPGPAFPYYVTRLLNRKAFTKLSAAC